MEYVQEIQVKQGMIADQHKNLKARPHDFSKSDLKSYGIAPNHLTDSVKRWLENAPAISQMDILQG